MSIPIFIESPPGAPDQQQTRDHRPSSASAETCRMIHAWHAWHTLHTKHNITYIYIHTSTNHAYQKSICIYMYLYASMYLESMCFFAWIGSGWYLSWLLLHAVIAWLHLRSGSVVLGVFLVGAACIHSGHVASHGMPSVHRSLPNRLSPRCCSARSSENQFQWKISLCTYPSSLPTKLAPPSSLRSGTVGGTLIL